MARPAPKKGRDQTRERQRRDRAATPTLRAQYPQFVSLRIEFDFSDSGRFTPAPQVCVLHPPSSAYFFFPCPYADCDGEFNLSPAVQELASSGEGHDQGQLQCTGHRRRDVGALQPCGLLLEFSISAPRA